MVWFWIAVAGWATALVLFAERIYLKKLVQYERENFEQAMDGWKQTNNSHRESLMQFYKILAELEAQLETQHDGEML